MRKLDSGDGWLDEAWSRLYGAVDALQGKQRIVKVDASDLRLILSQFKIAADATRGRARD